MIRLSYSLMVIATGLLSGCVASSVSPITQPYKISVSKKADQSVPGGMTVNTESLGEVHLEKPLLAAEFDGRLFYSDSARGPKDAQAQFMDISFKNLASERVINLSPMLFLQREGVSGMEENEILEALRSESFHFGSSVFLVVESEKHRAVFQLNTTWLDHPDYIYLQTDLKGIEWDFYAKMFEVHRLKKKGDPDSTEYPRGSIDRDVTSSEVKGSGDPLFAGEPLFTVINTGKMKGVPYRFKIIREDKDLIEMGFTAENLQRLSDRHVWKSENKTCPPDEDLRSMHGEHVVLTWKESNDSNTYSTKAIFWSRVPGLQFELDQPWRLGEIRRGLQNLKINDLYWHSLDYHEGGVTLRGGAL